MNVNGKKSYATRVVQARSWTTLHERRVANPFSKQVRSGNRGRKPEFPSCEAGGAAGVAVEEVAGLPAVTGATASRMALDRASVVAPPGR
jgi:hypothetical protein